MDRYNIVIFYLGSANSARLRSSGRYSSASTSLLLLSAGAVSVRANQFSRPTERFVILALMT